MNVICEPAQRRMADGATQASKFWRYFGHGGGAAKLLRSTFAASRLRRDGFAWIEAKN